MRSIKGPLTVLFVGISLGCSPASEAVTIDEDERVMNLYWGDIHNHNSVGQIKGSLERSYDIAMSHLDFFCFTPQSQWMDMVQIPQGRNAQFERGFKATRDNWRGPTGVYTGRTTASTWVGRHRTHQPGSGGRS